VRVPRPNAVSTDLQPISRVYAVVFGLPHPTNLSYIADCASLSVETTSNILSTLSDLDIVSVYPYDSTNLYGFNPKYLNSHALWRLCTEKTPQELSEMEDQLSVQLADWRDKYDLSPTPSRQESPADQPRSSVHPLIRGEWLFMNYYRELIQKAQTVLTT